MKTLAIIFTLASVAFAKSCQSGWRPTPEGVCQEGSSVGLDESKWVSDEKPPREKMPSYQREGIKVINAPTTGDDDIKQDEEAKAATAEGMAACEKKFGKGQCGERGKEPK